MDSMTGIPVVQYTFKHSDHVATIQSKSSEDVDRQSSSCVCLSDLETSRGEPGSRVLVQADNSFSARRRPVLWADIQDVVHCLLWGTTFTDRGVLEAPLQHGRAEPAYTRAIDSRYTSTQSSCSKASLPLTTERRYSVSSCVATRRLSLTIHSCREHHRKPFW